MPKKLVLIFIIFYQKIIRIFLPPSCRFFPSCSEYCYQAITQQGILKGGWLGIKRLLKCHPWHPGGVDELKNIVEKPRNGI